MRIQPKRRIKPVQLIALGFMGIILLGALLLMLPISTRDGRGTDFFDAVFTSVSATCVTGLVVQDTFTYFTEFGQIVILLLIQTGGLGFMIVATLFSLIFHKRINVHQRGLIRESINADSMGGIVRLTKRILYGTFIFEGVGAVLLSIRFVKDFGWLRGIYFGVFHSVSSFCNAGFDLMGINEKYSSLTVYRDDLLVNITVMGLIIIGGLGFIVWNDFIVNGVNFKKFTVHSKTVLVTSGLLIVVGALLVFGFENSTQTGNSPLTSLFQSVTARTAGFNTSNIQNLSDGSKLVTVILMFIGGSPGSTAGGIKTTTVVVVFLAFRSVFSKSSDLNIFGRRLEKDASRKAICVFITNLTLAMLATGILCLQHEFSLSDILMESFSAMSTVGLSSGITRDINTLSRLALMLLMYCGRVGSLSFALSFANDRPAAVQLPQTKINIG